MAISLIRISLCSLASTLQPHGTVMAASPAAAAAPSAQHQCGCGRSVKNLSRHKRLHCGSHILLASSELQQRAATSAAIARLSGHASPGPAAAAASDGTASGSAAACAAIPFRHRAVIDADGDADGGGGFGEAEREMGEAEREMDAEEEDEEKAWSVRFQFDG